MAMQQMSATAEEQDHQLDLAATKITLLQSVITELDPDAVREDPIRPFFGLATLTPC